MPPSWQTRLAGLNTVKSQQRSLSRKLGAVGRSNVLLEAERWGLLG